MLDFDMSKQHGNGKQPPKKLGKKAHAEAGPKRDYDLGDEDLENEGEDRSWGEKDERTQPPRPRIKVSHSSD